VLAVDSLLVLIFILSAVPPLTTFSDWSKYYRIALTFSLSPISTRV
jgi:hypothetical protein